MSRLELFLKVDQPDSQSERLDPFLISRIECQAS